MDDLISRQKAIDELHMHLMYRMGTESNKQRLDAWINNLPAAQPEPEIHWGYTPTYERPLADSEIVLRLRDIQKQVGGSYAIDRAIEIIEAVAERRTDGSD